MDDLINLVVSAYEGVVRATGLEGLVAGIGPAEWTRLAIGAAAFAVAGVVVGFVVGRRRPSTAAPPAKPKAPPAESEAEREKRLLESYRKILTRKGLSDEEAAPRAREFPGQLRELRDQLLALACDQARVAAMVTEADQALKEGELRRAVNLLYQAGERDAALGREMAADSIEHLAHAAVAMGLAGDLEAAQLNYDPAAECYRQAAEALPEGNEPRLAEYLEKHGTAAFRTGNHPAARASFERALKILEKTLGAHHAELATALNNLALVHYTQGDYAGAEPLYRRALAIDEKALGADHASVATDLNNLALLYKKQGNLKAAEPAFKRALAIKEKLFEPGHPSLVNGLKNYAQILRAMDRGEEAKTIEARLAPAPAPTEQAAS